ncbi:MAG: class I SAM-dependent methyltransferase [Candidatus Methanospirareceae archaeon]
MRVSYPFNGARYEAASHCQREWGIELVEELRLSGDESILDLGCGNGIITRALADRVPHGRVVGVDSSPSMLKTAEAHKTANIELRLLDITDIAFDAEFDVIFSNAALHWILDHRELLMRIYEALKPRGFMRVQFGGAGNIVHLIAIVREVMRTSEYAPWFVGFQWPWYMPLVEEYEALLAQTEFRQYRVWMTNRDRLFEHEQELVHMVDEAGLLPFLAALPEEMRPRFRDTIIEHLIARTRQPDGRCFETFRRINVYAEK